MARIAFWITAGPELADKAVAGLRLAERLATARQQEVTVFLYGPGVKLVGSDRADVAEALAALRTGSVPMNACPFNVKMVGMDPDVVSQAGVSVDKTAGEVLIQLVEDGYQVIGI